MVGPSTPLDYGFRQPVDKLPGLVASDYPPDMVTEHGEAQQVTKFPLQLLGC
jgi:hypothetical protein